MVEGPKEASLSAQRVSERDRETYIRKEQREREREIQIYIYIYIHTHTVKKIDYMHNSILGITCNNWQKIT